MNMKKLVVFLAFLFVSFVMVACSSPEGTGSDNKEADNGKQTNDSNDANENNGEDQPSGEPVVGGELSIADLNDAQGLDPHKETGAQSMRYIENMYNTLFKYKTGTYGEIEGELVEDYEISEDGLTYTFTLVDGVTFHNGDPLTSEDVKYSIERIVEMVSRAPQFEQVDKIETPDETTVVVTLKEPVAPFLTFLANPMNAIVNKNIVEENDGSLDRVDAGSGPFQLVEWKKDEQMVLEKYDDYFKEGLPYLDRIVWKAIPDETARTTAIRNDELDIILQLSPKDIQLLEGKDGINVESVTGSYWEYIGLNVNSGPLKEKAVRQAIAWAVNRDELNDAVKFGQATPLTGGPIPPGHWAYGELDTYPMQDVDKAKELLAEAGYPDGFDITVKVGQNQAQVDAAQVIKQQLKEVGINVKVNQLEDSIFFEDLGNKEFDMAIVGWVGFVDPDEFLYNIFHTGAIYNQQGYSNEEVDALLEKGRKTIGEEERKEIYTEAQRLIVEDAPMVFLYANQQASALRDDVKGFDVNPTVTTISLEETWIEQ
ncbi:ABC transporter substrate-binding protein [Aquibacillus salsiterrae]|uniref:ABC transporter substrate-binding protein n=1 Tax=Aquibacillus salsiterrae TaxID=2950439 RepID=A0A9X4ADQ9_9BACI|nr:ABC transporter substrate-binding protein [Aquibacillus salsiterrae]MDC3415822.1 ABC transporter substrate-binding protein [Aquibacillus salsiterrae]